MTAKEAGQADWITIRQACERLGVSRQTLYSYFHQGLLRRYRRGPRLGRIWLRREDVEALATVIFQEQEEKGAQQ